MPRGDGTGPMGQGPMTGRRAGYCAGYGVPGYMNAAPGGGWYGRGRGGRGGRGYRHMYYATGLPGWARYGAPAYGPAYAGPQAPTPEQETEALRAEAGRLEDALRDIHSRLSELEESESNE
ncbi:MAG: hypothetical protein GF405_10420 [Candidatus Eisenbacteria bacterium]|nr:hypothetical protein [Candidatus Eisenbacteria bacterium]